MKRMLNSLEGDGRGLLTVLNRHSSRETEVNHEKQIR